MYVRMVWIGAEGSWKRMAVFAGRILLPGAWPCGVSLCLATQSWNETAEELPETPYP